MNSVLSHVNPQILSAILIGKSFSFCQQQIRTTFILKRRVTPHLSAINGPPRKLKGKHYIYDLVKDTNTIKREPLEVVLLDFVEGIGLKGDVVSVKPTFARNHLLLPGLAVYASPENVERFAKKETADESTKMSGSPFAVKTERFLSRMVLNVIVNMQNQWTIEPWQIAASFRFMGVIVPVHAITMPPKPISGPNMELEGRVFLITVTLNGETQTIVRCRINHFTQDISKQQPLVDGYWTLPLELVFAEDGELINSLPAPPPATAKTV